MKKLMKLFVLVAAAAMALASCQKNEIPAPEKQEVHFTINAGIPQTKTTITDNGGGTYTPSWDGTENLAVLFQLPDANTEDSDAVKFTNKTGEGATATFSAMVSADKASTETLYAIYPYEAFGRGFDGGLARLDLNSDQKPTATSFDPSCDILVARPYDYAVNDGEVVVDPLYFTRVMSVLRVNLKSDFADINNEVVESIKFQTGGVNITGYAKISVENPEFTGEWTTKNDYVTATYDSDVVSINGDDNSVYFVVAPVTIPADKNLTFTIKTENYTITKTIEANNHPEMKFDAGNVAVINLNIKEEECTPISGGSDAEIYYEKVTSQPADWSGKYLLIVEDNVNKALSGISTTSTKYGLGTEVIINDNKINASGLSGYEVVISKASITDGAYILTFNSSLLYWNSGNSLATNSTESDKTNWTISLDNGKLSIYNCNTTNRQLLWNKTSPRFACYTGKEEDSGYYYPHLYKLVEDNEGGETQEPDQPKTPVLRVTSSEISVEAAGGTGEINYTIENPVDGVSVVASSDVDWITNISPTDDKVTFNVLENTGVERNAVVTLAYDGAEPVKVTVTQDRSQSVTLPEGVASIKVLATSTSEEEFAVALTDAVVTYVSGSNAYIEDAEAGILIYMSAHGLSMGDKLNGEVTGKVKLYNNLREVTSIDYTKATKTSGAAVPVTVLTLEDLNAEGAYDKYENMRIKIEDATVSAQGQISQGDQTYALYFKNSSVTGFDPGNTIDLFGYPSKYNDNIQFNIWENAIIKKVANTTITGVSDFSVEVGGTKEINASASSGENVTYVSANPEIATVDENGVVTGIAEGETTITVSVPANDVYPAAEEICRVTVTAASQGGDDTNEPITVTKSIKDISGTTANGTQVLTLKLDDVISATASKGTNNGKVYNTGTEWRLYMSDSGTVTVNAISGYIIKTVKFTYSQSNNGTLLSGTSQINSGTTYEVNAQSVTYTVGRTSGTKPGQVKVTAIEVVYQAN